MAGYPWDGMESYGVEVCELNILQGTLNAKMKVKPSPAALLNTAGGAPQPPSPYSIMMQVISRKRR
jgi:hypothetical protein